MLDLIFAKDNVDQCLILQSYPSTFQQRKTRKIRLIVKKVQSPQSPETFGQQNQTLLFSTVECIGNKDYSKQFEYLVWHCHKRKWTPHRSNSVIVSESNIFSKEKIEKLETDEAMLLMHPKSPARLYFTIKKLQERMNSMSKTGWSKESSNSIFSNEKKVKMKVDSSNRWSDLEWDEDIQYDKLSTEGWKSCKEERRGSKQFAHERHVTIFDLYVIISEYPNLINCKSNFRAEFQTLNWTKMHTCPPATITYQWRFKWRRWVLCLVDPESDLQVRRMLDSPVLSS